MKETAQDREIRYGVCPQCGRRIVLPCLACRVEAIRRSKRAGHPVEREERIDEDLAIRLETPGQRRRYEEVRAFRDRYHIPMWPEQ